MGAATPSDIAILGWGSLLWDKDEKFDHWLDLPWRPDGPVLKIEFSRISKRRLGALTLVIDPKSGTPTPVAYCLSKRTDLDDAITDLRCREGTPIKNIGYLCREKNQFRARQSGVRDMIGEWATERSLMAVVWTDLESNFQEKTGRPFSTRNAIEHLNALSSEKAKAKAKEYLQRAPDFVRTPLRTALQGTHWFDNSG